jgi:cell division protein FtsQ
MNAARHILRTTHTHDSSRHAGGVAFKLVAWLAALSLIALPVVGVVNGWFAADRWPFRQVRVEASFARVSAEQVRAAASPHLNRGFFAVKLDDVRQAVEQLPWVARAEVRKRWPDLLEVRVIEREAVASWGDTRLLTATGDVFDVPGTTMPQGLPRLSGPDTRAAEVLAFFASARATLAPLDLHPMGLSLSARGSWTLELDRGVQVLIGSEDAATRLARFVAAYPHADVEPGTTLLAADLRYANGFALRWQAPAPAPAAMPALDPSAPVVPNPVAPHEV